MTFPHTVFIRYVNIFARILCFSKLGLHLPHPVHKQEGSARFITEREELEITLPMNRPMDCINLTWGKQRYRLSCTTTYSTTFTNTVLELCFYIFKSSLEHNVKIFPNQQLWKWKGSKVCKKLLSIIKSLVLFSMILISLFPGCNFKNNTIVNLFLIHDCFSLCF